MVDVDAISFTYECGPDNLLLFVPISGIQCLFKIYLFLCLSSSSDVPVFSGSGIVPRVCFIEAVQPVLGLVHQPLVRLIQLQELPLRLLALVPVRVRVKLLGAGEVCGLDLLLGGGLGHAQLEVVLPVPEAASCCVEAEVEVEEGQLRGEPAHKTTAAEAQHARCSPPLHPPRRRQGPLVL